MGKKILVIPDVHGRTFWKEPVSRYSSSVDKSVFLGDYLDPYNSEEGLADDIFENLMEIISLKLDNMDKVVLLKGNHDQHYASKRFEDLAAGTRMDYQNWSKYHQAFNEYKDLFKIAHLETVNDVPYVFSHAGMTLYWLKKVNENVWKLFDNQISLASPDIIDRINLLDDDGIGQEMLAVVGRNRSMFGEETGGVLWADVFEHDMPHAPKAYGLDKVFQVFGHTRLRRDYDSLEYDHFAMIDSRQCFVIDEELKERIVTLHHYVQNHHDNVQ